MTDANRLPPLSALVPFEAAGRLGSMSAAARELGISQPAVSRHLALLEAALGRVLFLRTRRGLVLTDAGRDYLGAVGRGLDEIGRATELLRQRNRGRTIRLAANFGVAQQWLMQRLPALRAAEPDLYLRLVTSDRDDELDLADCDLAIRFGTGHWPRCRAVKLWDEEVAPVCSPAYLAAHPALDAADLAGAQLLHMDEASERWLTWASWFAARGVSARLDRPTLLYTTYPLLLQAALAGDGVALGWRGLVDDLVAERRLVRLGPSVRRASHGYFLCLPQDRALPAATARLVERVAKWIEQTAMS